MNFSTISNKSTLENQTIHTLTHDELMESYSQLKFQFENLSKTHDKLKQDYHETRRNYETALDVQEHLNAEVDSVQKIETKHKRELNDKIHHLQESLQTLTTEKNDLSDGYEKQVNELKSQLKATEKRDLNEVENVGVLQSRINRLNEDCKNLMNDKDQLKLVIEEQEELIKNGENANQTLQSKIEAVSAETDFLKDNLKYKKEELDSKTDLLSLAQEEVCLLKVELQSLKSDSSKHAAKGNSLFAEVEDKRQEMIHSLSTMKEKYSQLKIDLVNKQKEVDELLKEKKTLWAEYDGQASQQDAILIAGYEKRITDLEKACEQQRREINRWYCKNLNPGSSELDQWITGVLSHKSEQCLHLSDELSASSVDCLAKEKKIRQLHSQILSLRFKMTSKELQSSNNSYNGEVTALPSYRPINQSLHNKNLDSSESVK